MDGVTATRNIKLRIEVPYKKSLPTFSTMRREESSKSSGAEGSCYGTGNRHIAT